MNGVNTMNNQYIYVIITQEGTLKDVYSSNVLAKRMCPNGCYIVKYEKV